MSVLAAAHAGPRHRRPRLTLYGYLVRETLRPAAVALLGLTAVVLTTQVLHFSELVINRGVDLAAVGRILFYEAVPVAGRMLPFGVLVGALFALGRLGADQEILALESSGIAPARLVGPVVTFSAGAALVALAMGLFATPWASRSLDAELAAIARAKPWADLRAGVVQRFGEWQLEAREVAASGDRLRGVMLWTPEIGETIFARRGLLAGAAGGDVEVALEDGALVLARRDGVQHLRFDRLETRLPAGQILGRTEADRILGLPLGELARRAAAFVPSEGNRISAAALELQRRFAYPCATLVFGLLAVPLFLTRGHASRSAGGVMGLLCTLAYYGLVQLSEGLIQGGSVGVALGAWLPNGILGALALLLLWRASRERAFGRRFERVSGRRPRPARAAAAREDARQPRLHRNALPRYVASRFLQLSALTFSALFAAYFLIDVMGRLEWFARHGATGAEALRFYSARAPLLASRAVPMAILVATSLTVSLLAAEGELLGMRACGIPSLRALLPLFVLSALVAPLYFLFNNSVLPRTNALADHLKKTEIKEGVYMVARAGVWHRAGSMVLQAGRLDPAQGVASEVTLYRLGEDWLPVAREDAESMHHVGRGNWRLVAPSRIEIEDGAARRAEPRAYAELGESLEAEVDTMHMSVGEVAREIEATERAGLDATILRVDYHVKLAEPLSCIVLPAVVLFFAVTGPPFPGPAQTLLLSGIIGVVYILLSGVAASVGHGGQVSPALAGFGPIAAFAVLLLVFAHRMWRRL